jgi:hypothetical protein
MIRQALGEEKVKAMDGGNDYPLLFGYLFQREIFNKY